MTRTVLLGGTVVDVVSGERRAASVVLADGRITEVGQLDPGPEDEVVDVKGKWIFPALTNCHVHLGWDGVHDLQPQAEWPAEIASYTAAMNIARTLHAGVTTVRDLGMKSVGMFAKRAIEDGRAPYLRLFHNGRAISITGGHTWYCCREADGEDDCRKAIREQYKAGASWIKIMACHRHDQFTQHELEAMVDEAHQLGLKVTAHATMDSTIRRVAEAGVDCVEHGGSMSDGTIEALIDRKVWLVTTYSALFLQGRYGLEHGMSQATVDSRLEVMSDPATFADVRRAIQGGVRHAFGTDAGSPIVPHDEIVEELKGLVEFGVCEDNLDALRSATIRAADLMGLAAELGRVEPGMTADLLVLDGDPLVNVENLRRINRVYVRGDLAVLDGTHMWPRLRVEVPLRLPQIVA